MGTAGLRQAQSREGPLAQHLRTDLFFLFSKSKVSSRYKESYLRVQGNETTLVVVMEFDKLYHSLYGAPESIYAIYRTSNESHSISFETIVLFSSLSLIQSYSIRPQRAFPSRFSLYST